MSAIIEIRGATGIQLALKQWLDPELSKNMDAGTKKAAQLYARELRTAVRPLSRRMARSVNVHRAKRDKPAWVIGSRRKTAFFWPFVIDGTRDHGPKKAQSLYFRTPDGQTHRPKRVRGVQPHPVVEQVARSAEPQAAAEVDKYMKARSGI